MSRVSSIAELNSVRDYLGRIGGRVRSMRTAVVEERSGRYWRDLAVVRFERNGEVKTDVRFEPTESEQQALIAEFATATFPANKVVFEPSHWPDEVQALIDEGDLDSWFQLRNTNGELVMVQVRRKVRRDGEERAYIPWSLWDDDVWRQMEPEGDLPLWGMEHIKDQTTVFIHEGAKAARAMHRMVSRSTPAERDRYASHPWAEELSNAAHIGWIGGALSPQRTDWSALKKAGVKRAFIVSDNDNPGRSAVPGISFKLDMITFHVQFDQTFPGSFDLADEFPDSMFEGFEGGRTYIGPPFRTCVHPATWATDLVPNKSGKPTPTLREHFKDLFAYVEASDLFVCKEMPHIVRPEKIMNNLLAPFSHAAETTKLIVKAYNGRTVSLSYRPDQEQRMVIADDSSINLHVPGYVKSKPGNPKPFIEFMEYLIPDAKECMELLRWCATIIAQPGTRMEYGVLLVSERQGIGKTTLGSSILAPLVGRHNTGYPQESMIVNSDFNDWLANKRLVIVNEIYSGHSWKAYNTLKSYITDKQVTVNVKYQRPYTVDNWAHIFACSNSMNALRMEEDDRRWFHPKVAETPWAREQFVALNKWLGAGGLGVIKNWAEGFELAGGRYVMPGERAPMTDAKKSLIRESMSEAKREAIVLGEALRDYGRPAAIGSHAARKWVQETLQKSGRVFDGEKDLAKAMKVEGTWSIPEMKVDGRAQVVIFNGAMKTQVEGMTNADQRDAIRKCILPPGELMKEGF
jgi:hypothetical protein